MRKSRVTLIHYELNKDTDGERTKERTGHIGRPHVKTESVHCTDSQQQQKQTKQNETDKRKEWRNKFRIM